MEHPYFCSVGAYIKTWVLTDPQHGDWVPVLLSELPSSYAVGLLVPGCEIFLRSLGTFAFEWNTGDLPHPLHTMTVKSTWQTETVLQDWNKITKTNNLKKTELFFSQLQWRIWRKRNSFYRQYENKKQIFWQILSNGSKRTEEFSSSVDLYTLGCYLATTRTVNVCVWWRFMLLLTKHHRVKK